MVHNESAEVKSNIEVVHETINAAIGSVILSPMLNDTQTNQVYVQVMFPYKNGTEIVDNDDHDSLVADLKNRANEDDNFIVTNSFREFNGIRQSRCDLFEQCEQEQMSLEQFIRTITLGYVEEQNNKDYR